MKVAELLEASVAKAKVGSAMSSIVSYLGKQLGVTLVKIPGVEHFKNSKGDGYGVRYVLNGSIRCIRFNWDGAGAVGKSASLRSIDLFSGRRNPTFTVLAHDISFVKALPALVSILKSPTLGKRKVTAAELTEAPGQPSLEVIPGGSNEQYEQTAQEERIPYTETLRDLNSIVKNLVAGRANALFVCGSAGTGKTHTVEKALRAAGKMDEDGYYKNSGVTSTAGMYTLLYQHRHDIVLFDDSDSALEDQDSRNILKAAADTKKQRKISYTKKANTIYNPDQEGATERYADDPDMAPNRFDFYGRIIVISNLPIDKLDPDRALRSRAFVVDVNPTVDEVFEQIQKLMYDIKIDEGSLTRAERDHVFEIIKKSKRREDVTLRTMVRALNIAASGCDDWEALIRRYA